MELRGHTTAEIRKSSRLMGKGPDLSAFPIPRKGGAKPIAMDEAREMAMAEEQGRGLSTPQVPAPPTPALPLAGPAGITAEAEKPAVPRASQTEEPPLSTPLSSGQTVATTVKLDENRYLRLADAGKPGPGRLKRRTIQDMVIEALDEWFERRGI